MKQHGMKQVSCDTDVGKITTDYRVLDGRRPILADLGREEDQVLPNPTLNAVDVGSESLSHESIQ